jgi:ubiquinone/menaquinone biosynthesis C-methylase UbiE
MPANGSTNPEQLSAGDGTVSYLLGHSATEIRRLVHQAAMLGPITERLLKTAGLREGMRVLDMGCGLGDVTMLAARMVGPTGSVTGIDQSTDVVRMARQRTGEEKTGNVSFEVATLPGPAGLENFDAVIGRYILVHQSDPAGFLRQIAKCLRPGGLIVCHEAYPRFPICSSPPLAPWQQVGDFLQRTAAHFPGVDACEHIQQTFDRAGFRTQEIYYEIPVAQDSNSPLIEWVTNSAQTFLPLAEAKGVSSDPIDLSTLEQRSRDAMRNSRSHVTAWLQICAWAIV